MELEFSSNCEFELPSYMSRLSPEEVDREVKDKNCIVIAAGTDPKDGKITLLTATGKVMIFDSRKYCIPDGPSFPANGGKEVFLKNIQERWPSHVLGFYVDVKWMLEKSLSGLEGATLMTNYIHEDNNT